MYTRLYPRHRHCFVTIGRAINTGPLCRSARGATGRCIQRLATTRRLRQDAINMAPVDVARRLRAAHTSPEHCITECCQASLTVYDRRANEPAPAGDMSSLLAVVVGLSLVVAQNDDVVRELRSRAAARRLLRLSHDVARTLRALNFRLSADDDRSAVCYVIEHVPEVTVGDVTETVTWSRRRISIPLRLTEYRRKPRHTPSDVVSIRPAQQVHNRIVRALAY